MTTLANANQHLDEAMRLLQESELRVTGPRRAILKVLTSEHGPFTVDEIFSRLEPHTCDLVTIYRSVAALEGAGIVRRCDFGDGIYRYEYNIGEDHHHHIVCRSCHKVEVLEFCVVDVLERMARQRGYTRLTHTLELFGLCPECSSKKNQVAEGETA
jgi:Fur family ferric uptake transcriptional regulator